MGVLENYRPKPFRLIKPLTVDDILERQDRKRIAEVRKLYAGQRPGISSRMLRVGILCVAFIGLLGLSAWLIVNWWAF